jgi:hypothetical protein
LIAVVRETVFTYFPPEKRLWLSQPLCPVSLRRQSKQKRAHEGLEEIINRKVTISEVSQLR